MSFSHNNSRTKLGVKFQLASCLRLLIIHWWSFSCC